MTRFIRVGIAAAAAATAMTFDAQAADMRPVYKARPPVAVYSWTGCYIGGQVGGQWARWTGAVNYPAGDPLGHPAVNASRDFDGDGRFIYGGQIGCNWQPFGTSFVLGVEGDVVGVSRGEVGGEVHRYAAPFATDHFNTTGSYGTQGSLRLRGGFAIDRVLLYVAGGVTWANLSATHNFFRDGDGSLAFTASTTRNGWNIGAGLEYAFINSWTLGIEYRYTDYGSFTNNIAAGTAGTLSWSAFTISANDLRTQDVRLRLNYLFGMGGPVVARY
jgi:outer membrane immunogenic protein